MDRTPAGSGALSRDFSLSTRAAPARWALLLLLSIVLIVPLQLLRLPAALLLGAMSAAIVIAVGDGALSMPRWPFLFAQALIGCLVARSIGPSILATLSQQWPVFLAGVGAVLVISTSLGLLLARWRVLPGTTAVWGSAPGAATVMVLMAEGFGGDARLVAFMQFLRVMMVAIAASLVARWWVAPGATVVPASIDWFPALGAVPLAETLALAGVGTLLGVASRLPAGALLVPLVAGIVLSTTHLVTITLPPWLMAGSYALLGWAIGLRFTRDIVLYAARAFWKIMLSTIVLIALCAALGWLLHLAIGTDPLTAYLATSPGGADSVAVIAASAPVDVPFVMAMQMARFMIVLVVGPPLAKRVARWAS